jgi:hypothetical protein
MDLKEFLDDEVNKAATNILTKGDKIDEVALGKLHFFLALRRALTKKASPEELGLLDAVNDTLQALEVVPKGKVFYKKK